MLTLLVDRTHCAQLHLLETSPLMHHFVRPAGQRMLGGSAVQRPFGCCQLFVGLSFVRFVLVAFLHFFGLFPLVLVHVFFGDAFAIARLGALRTLASVGEAKRGGWALIGRLTHVPD